MLHTSPAPSPASAIREAHRLAFSSFFSNTETDLSSGHSPKDLWTADTSPAHLHTCRRGRRTILAFTSDDFRYKLWQDNPFPFPLWWKDCNIFTSNTSIFYDFHTVLSGYNYPGSCTFFFPPTCTTSSLKRNKMPTKSIHQLNTN